MGLERVVTQPLPPVAGTCEGTLLVIGNAACVWDDIEKAPPVDAVMAVNDIGMYYPGPLAHWWSNHGERLEGWSRVRAFHYPGPVPLHSLHERARVIGWPFPGRGSSGLVACFCGLGLGYGHVVMAGIPLDDTPYFFGPRPKSPANFTRETNERHLKIAREVFDGRVTSMSGRSKTVFG